LATEQFSYNKNNHISIGVSLFKANYGFNPSYSRIPSSEQCILAVEEWLKQIYKVQSELKLCLEAKVGCCPKQPTNVSIAALKTAHQTCSVSALLVPLRCATAVLAAKTAQKLLKSAVFCSAV
jgi:hypothetical protein